MNHGNHAYDHGILVLRIFLKNPNLDNYVIFLISIDKILYDEENIHDMLMVDQISQKVKL